MAMNFDIDFDAWRKPKMEGISGCIRVRNESQFMAQAVRSFLPYLDEIVLVVQPSEDDTLDIAEYLAEENEKVKVYQYDMIPDWIDTPGFYNKDPDQPGHLVHMSNWALAKCRYSWVCKVEGDVISSSRMAAIIDRVRENENFYYGLAILNVAGENYDKISYENPRNGGWDEAIFPNHPDLVRFVRRGKWEVLVPNVPSLCAGWALWHMKRCKIGKAESWNGEHYLEWTEENVAQALREYNGRVGGYPGPDHPLMRVPWMTREAMLEAMK
jgi:hypothetical protein